MNEESEEEFVFKMDPDGSFCSFANTAVKNKYDKLLLKIASPVSS